MSPVASKKKKCVRYGIKPDKEECARYTLL